MSIYAFQCGKFQVVYSGRFLGLLAGKGREGSRTGIARGQSGHYCRKFHAEDRPAGLAVVANDISTMLAYDAIANTQSQSRPFSNGFGGIERIEHPVRFFQAWPSIGEKNNHVAAIAHGSNGQYP